jgi:uncharacterized protein YbaP (TraB family)
MRSVSKAMAARAAVIAALLLALVISGAQAAAGPALWLVQGPKAKVYIFGTIHLMKPGVTWSTPAVDQALAESSDLWLELPDDLRDPSAVLPLVQTYGLDPAHPLSTKITKDDLQKLDAFIKANGLPGEAQFEPLRPWLAALLVTLLPAKMAGYQGELGIDQTLRGRMTAAGKPVKGFETISEQLQLFAGLTQAQEVAFLHSTLATSGDTKTKSLNVDKLVEVWQTGDVAQAMRFEAEMGGTDQAFAASFLTNRNAKWAKQLDERLKGDGTSFVAVGLLHLVGDGSLLDDLTKLGYTVTRIQ